VPAFEIAPYELRKMAHELANEHHRGLRKVKLGILLASSATKLPAIQAKPTSAMHRAAGCADLLIIVSDSAWQRRDDTQRRALLDHALSSVQVIERNGELSTDTAGRPRLRRIAKDCAVGYVEPWRRWGEASIEAQAMAKLKRVAADLAK
jgi:hypothetical protein